MFKLLECAVAIEAHLAEDSHGLQGHVSF